MSSGNVRIPTENIHVIQMDPTSSVKQLKWRTTRKIGTAKNLGNRPGQIHLGHSALLCCRTWIG